MPGPELRNPFAFDLPSIESGLVYKPASIARRIVNLYVTPDGTLASVRGPCTYEIGGKIALGQVFGICHCSTLGGANDVLVVRAGSTLYRHAGWNRTWEPVPVGANNDVTNGTLNTDDRQPFPDAMVAMNGLIIWSNGIDRPRLVDCRSAYGSRLAFLGFSDIPSRPLGLGPSSYMDNVEAGTDDYPTTPPNWFGYSHRGRIGTIGDEMLGQDGNLQAGSWQYAVQLEDDFGNRSPVSPLSNAVLVRTQSCSYDAAAAAPQAAQMKYLRHNTTDDLTRQFVAKGLDRADASIAYVLLHRTPDTRHYPADLHLLARIPGQGPICFPDNVPDGLLLGGPIPQDLHTTPKFRICWEYQGRLCAANTSSHPGSLWISEPGLPGTYQTKYRVEPDPTGAEVTGGFGANGANYVMTARSIFAVSIQPDGLRAEPISRTIGCVAPGSIVAMPDGSMIWLGRDAFYQFDGQSVRKISDAIFPTVERINLGRAGRAVAQYDVRTAEYICAVPMDSSYGNNRILAYDPASKGWREQVHGITYRAMTTTNDHRAYLLAGGNIGTDNDVYLLDHESRTYTPPLKTYRFESVELRVDPSGRRRGNIPTIYFGFVESEIPTNANIRWYRDGRRVDPVDQEITLVDVDIDPTQSWGTAVLGTSVYQTPKLFWRKADVGIIDCTSFRFDLTITEPAHITLAGIVFDGNLTDHAGSRVPEATS